MVTRSQNNIFKPKQFSPTSKLPLAESIEPACVTQALKLPKLRVAMLEEFNALIKNGIWELVPSKSSQNIIGCK